MEEFRCFSPSDLIIPITEVSANNETETNPVASNQNDEPDGLPITLNSDFRSTSPSQLTAVISESSTDADQAAASNQAEEPKELPETSGAPDPPSVQLEIPKRRGKAANQPKKSESPPIVILSSGSEHENSPEPTQRDDSPEVIFCGTTQQQRPRRRTSSNSTELQRQQKDLGSRNLLQSQKSSGSLVSSKISKKDQRTSGMILG